jgi:hypothetical protein
MPVTIPIDSQVYDSMSKRPYWSETLFYMFASVILTFCVTTLYRDFQVDELNQTCRDRVYCAGKYASENYCYNVTHRGQ